MRRKRAYNKGRFLHLLCRHHRAHCFTQQKYCFRAAHPCARRCSTWETLAQL